MSKLQDSGQLQTTLALYDQDTTKQWATELFQIQDCGRTSNSSANEDAQLQSPERNRWKRSNYQETRREKSLRGEESGRMFPVESTWTMFKRRLLYLQSWASIQKRTRPETRRTNVLSRAKSEGTEWRKVSLSKVQATEGRILLELEADFRA